jgi:hypothetical protein
MYQEHHTGPEMLAIQSLDIRSTNVVVAVAENVVVRASETLVVAPVKMALEDERLE